MIRSLNLLVRVLPRDAMIPAIQNIAAPVIHALTRMLDSLPETLTQSLTVKQIDFIRDAFMAEMACLRAVVTYQHPT